MEAGLDAALLTFSGFRLAYANVGAMMTRTQLESALFRGEPLSRPHTTSRLDYHLVSVP
jgi:hypothetical protein